MNSITSALAGGALAALLAATPGTSAAQNLSGSKAVNTSTQFMDRTYHLGSFNQKNTAMWEFVPASETVDNWTSLLTVIDRPDAHSREELDRLAEGIMQNYQSHKGQILMAKTMVGKSGEPFNYMVVAFDQPALRRYELSFAKVGLAQKNAYVMVYGVRIIDPDYVGKAKAFLTQHSGEIGKALETAALPEISSLPRKEF